MITIIYSPMSWTPFLHGGPLVVVVVVVEAVVQGREGYRIDDD